jgi:hypothetical protein
MEELLPAVSLLLVCPSPIGSWVLGLPDRASRIPPCGLPESHTACTGVKSARSKARCTPSERAHYHACTPSPPQMMLSSSLSPPVFLLDNNEVVDLNHWGSFTLRTQPYSAG